jgi:hypothetical protein
MDVSAVPRVGDRLGDPPDALRHGDPVTRVHCDTGCRAMFAGEPHSSKNSSPTSGAK